MSAAEDRFWQDCDASLARVRSVRAAVDETWDDPAVAADLDELQAGVDAHERDEERRLAERALRAGETPF